MKKAIGERILNALLVEAVILFCIVLTVVLLHWTFSTHWWGYGTARSTCIGIVFVCSLSILTLLTVLPVIHVLGVPVLSRSASTVVGGAFISVAVILWFLFLMATANASPFDWWTRTLSWLVPILAFVGVFCVVVSSLCVGVYYGSDEREKDLERRRRETEEEERRIATERDLLSAELREARAEIRKLQTTTSDELEKTKAQLREATEGEEERKRELKEARAQLRKAMEGEEERRRELKELELERAVDSARQREQEEVEEQIRREVLRDAEHSDKPVKEGDIQREIERRVAYYWIRKKN